MKHSMAQQVNTLQEKNEIERELHRQKTEALELQNRMERSRLQDVYKRQAQQKADRLWLSGTDA